MLRTFCFYPGAHTTAIISLLTVKCGNGAAVSLFSVTTQVAAILLEQTINMFYNPPSTVLSTALTRENRNG